MIKNLERRDAMKAIAAFGSVLLLRGVAFGQILNRRGKLASGWLYLGQPCLIYQQGAMLLFINEAGSVGSGVWTGKNAFKVLGGRGWDAGLTAQVANAGNTINWSNNTVWTEASLPRHPRNLEGGWLYQAQPCAIFQQENQLLLLNEVGAIGVGLWTGLNSFTVLGGSGWDLGLIAQVADRGQTLVWSNDTVWKRS